MSALPNDLDELLTSAKERESMLRLKAKVGLRTAVVTAAVSQLPVTAAAASVAAAATASAAGGGGTSATLVGASSAALAAKWTIAVLAATASAAGVWSLTRPSTGEHSTQQQNVERDVLPQPGPDNRPVLVPSEPTLAEATQSQGETVERSVAPTVRRERQRPAVTAAQPQTVAPTEIPVQPDMAGEVRLIGQARRLESQGQLTESLGALRDHQRLYPNGVLVEEREALLLMVQCRQGQANASAIERFRTRFPTSVFRGRIASVCAD